MRTTLNPLGWVRLVLYVLSALVGLAAVVVNALGMSDLSVLLGTVAGAGAAVTGGVATFNLPKAPDHQPGAGVDLTSLLPAVVEIADAARAYRGAVSYTPQHATVVSPYDAARSQLGV